MKTPPMIHRHPDWTRIAIAALCLPASLALANPLFTDDFESLLVNEAVPSGGTWAVATFTGGSLLVRDQNTAAPFGSPNQYVEFDDTNAADSVRLQSQPFAVASNALTTFSFDFSEPTTGGDSQIFVGYAIDELDLLSLSRRIYITLDDGTIGNVTGGSNTYSLDTAYRLHIVFNDTASTVNYSAGSIDSGSAAVWLENLSSGIFSFAGTTGSQNTEIAESSYNVAFRSFNANLQTIHLDNVSLVEGAPVIPMLDDDFESYTVGETVPTGGNWSSISAAGGSTMGVRDENTAAPFGSPNQYAEFADTSAVDIVRLRSRTFTAASNALTTFSFDFVEPNTGGNDLVSVGYAIDNLDLLSASRRVQVTLDDGVLGGLSGGSSIYNLDTAYRLYIILNDTDSPVTYSADTIPNGVAHVWLENLTSGIFTFAGSRAAENAGTVEISYNVSFRTVANALQTIYLDNMSLVAGAPDIPLIDDDFESYTADAAVTTGAYWSNVSALGGSLNVRDEITAAPFGSPNQYLEYVDNSDIASVRLQSRTFTVLSNAVSTFAFDFNEPSSGGDSVINVGYSIDNLDLLSTNRRISVTLDDGVVGGVSGGTSNTYNQDTAYRLYLIFNDTDSPVNYPGGSIASGTAAVWLKEVSGGTFTFAGTTAAQNTGIVETSYNVAFRSFTADTQTLHVDNVSLTMGAASIPDTTASGFESWAATNNATGQSLDDDHDGDGVSNGIEYFLGGPNGVTTGFTPLPGVTPGLSVTWIKGPGYAGDYDADFWVETSETLANPWTKEIDGVNVNDTATNVTYTFPSPLGVKKFVRLRVTGP